MKKLLLIFISILLSLNLALANSTETDATATGDDRVKQNLIDKLLPNQDKLFKHSKKIDLDLNQEITEDEQIYRLAEGDLEKQILPRIFQLVFLLSGTVFMGIFVYAGIMLIVRQDEEEALTKTKNILIDSLIGVIVIGVSYAIITGVISYFDLIR